MSRCLKGIPHYNPKIVAPKMQSDIDKALNEAERNIKTKTLFHGTGAGEFVMFKISPTANGGLGPLKGHYFTRESKRAERWSRSWLTGKRGRVVKARVKLNNPASPSDLRQAISELGYKSVGSMYGTPDGAYDVEAVTNLLIEKGFDSYVSSGYEKESGGMEETIVFNPSNIKIISQDFNNKVEQHKKKKTEAKQRMDEKKLLRDRFIKARNANR